MRTSLGRILRFALVAVLLAVLAPTTVLAQGTGPEDAFSPCCQMMPIQPGETLWYVFHDEGDGRLIEIELFVDPDNGAEFEVLTPDQLKLWQDGLEYEPIGRGTENDAIDADLNWAGNFLKAADYYVLVKNRTAEVSFYRLVIKGKDVSFPSKLLPSMTQPAAPTERTVAPAPVAAPVTPGIYAVDGQWRTLAMGATNWYAFDYTGDDTAIQITVDEKTAGMVNFNVWTPDLYARKMKGEEVDPIGRGTENPCVEVADLNWQGSFNFSGRFYVEVTHTCQQGMATYLLNVTGKDVSYPPMSGAAPAPAPVARTVEPAAPVPAPEIFSVDGQWRQLAMQQIHWYAFNYDGDDETTIEIDVLEETAGMVNFNVWTPDLYARKMKGEEVDPIGRGAVNPCIEVTDLHWAGSFNFSGRFYVEVTHTCQQGMAT
ncbi:MAG: hypothetical protein KDD84_11095, partial [Caldilineaceae bacterium]|nr:hypothetical protein [Caldilineaceae bacterium]